MPKIDYNGVAREMTSDEIAALPQPEIPEPSLEEHNRADIDYLLMMTGV